MTTRTTTSSTSKRRTSSKSSPGKRRPPEPPRPTWRDFLTYTHPKGIARRTRPAHEGEAWLGEDVIWWIETNCVHTNDRWTGRPFRLLLWQKMVLLCLFTLGDDGRRLIRWALIGIAKKQGKTELVAALALFFAFGPSGPDGEPEPSALVICAAGNDDQADLVFQAARTMCELSPTLSQITEVYEAEIICPSLPGSKIRRVSAAAKKTSSTLDGPNIYVVIADELHCWEGNGARVVWNTLTNGGVTRRQPLVLQITTAFWDDDTICGEQYEYGQAVAAGKVDDPRYFFWWVEAPQGCDHTDPAVIEASNPSFGVTVSIEFYLDQITKKTEAVFRRYFLNQKTDASETWLPQGVWDACRVDSVTIDPNLPSWGATDAATKWDSTANVQVQWNPATGRLKVVCRVWERPWDPRTRRPVEDWKLPVAEVEDDIRTRWKASAASIDSWGFDPAYFHRSAEALEAEGIPFEEIPQSDARMVPASQNLYQLIMEGLVEHDGDPDLARHIHNAAAVQTRGGNGAWRISKGKSKKKMDAAVALAMAAHLATAVTEKKPAPATAAAEQPTGSIFRPSGRLRI